MNNCYFNYSKEAQKCFCGTEKCRGTIGINKSTPLKSKKKPAEQEEDKEDLFQEEDVRFIKQVPVSKYRPNLFIYQLILYRLDQGQDMVLNNFRQ